MWLLVLILLYSLERDGANSLIKRINTEKEFKNSFIYSRLIYFFEILKSTCI